MDASNSNKTKVLRKLFLNPTYRFHIRELARITKIHPNTIIDITNRLKEEGVIKKEKRKNLVEVFLDLPNKEVIWGKKLFNLEQIYSCGIIDVLVKEYNPTAISLIGSYSKGEDLEKSDIDIIVSSNKDKIINLEKFEKILHRKIHLLIYNKKVSDEFFNNLINGITIYGAITK